MASENYSCAPFNQEYQTVSEFLERFEVQMAAMLHTVRSDSVRKAGIILRALPVQIITDLQKRLTPMKLHEATYDDVTENYSQIFHQEICNWGIR